jgi:hypothetical protein
MASSHEPVVVNEQKKTNGLLQKIVEELEHQRKITGGGGSARTIPVGS